MKHNPVRHQFVLSFFLLFIMMAVFFPITGVKADANVSGYAWSSDFGWIMFSSSTPPLGSRDKTDSDRTFAERLDTAVSEAKEVLRRLALSAKFSLFGVAGVQMEKPAIHLTAALEGFIRASASMTNQLFSTIDFGVKIARAAADYEVKINVLTGEFSGYAWSDNAGWIYFGPDGNLPGYGSVQASAAPTAPRTWATWSGTLEEPDSLTGWVKMLALGDNGWIKMSDPSWVGRGGTIKTNGDFDGWAWNAGAGGGSGLGWISLNNTACAMGGACATGPITYKVLATGLNQRPIAFSLTAPNWASSSAKTSGALHAFLRWNFRDPDNRCIGGLNNGAACISAGDCPGSGATCSDCPGGSSCNTQLAYRVVITRADNSPVYDTGQVNSSGNQFDTSPYLQYDTSYRWIIYVYDNHGAVSLPIVYNSNSASDTDKNIDNNPATFTTFKHEFPRPRFSWLPLKPSKEQQVNFSDQSQIYLSTAPTTPIPATDANADWLWTFNNGTPATSNSLNPVATFVSTGNTMVTMSVTDLDGCENSTSTQFNIKLKLPTWKEENPE